MKAPVLPLSYQGESLKQILSRLPRDISDVLLCGDVPASQSDLIAWVYAPEVMSEWQDAGTYLGQEEDQSPTIALKRGAQSVRLRFASAWFDEPVDAGEATRALGAADDLIRQRWRVADANFASPVALGRHLMTAGWNYDGIKVPPAPPEIRELLTTIGPQGRHECLTLPELTEIPALYGYDMRLAYLWCCKSLPFGGVSRLDFHPNRAEPQKVLAGWSAPDGWSHIGLLPLRTIGWRYPLTGEGWMDERELSLADRNGWRLDPTEALYWEQEGALDRWADNLQWCLRQSKQDRLVYRLFRRVALNTIGSLHRSSVRRTRALPAGGREQPPAGNPTLRLSSDGQTYFWQEEEAIGSRGLLYCHPEWTTTIWARCRARIAQAALQFEREQVIAIRQDALWVSEVRVGWKDDGAIGRFRVKEAYRGPMPAPHSLEDLQALRKADDNDHQ